MPNPTIPADHETKIRRIETGLIPAALSDTPSPEPASITSRMDYYNIPGVSIAVIEDYRLAWARGYGRLADGRPQAVDVDTLFQAASISKTVAALTGLRLIEAGQLNLDEDVNNYLKSWQVPANNGWQPGLTLRQLLSHTAGLTVSGFPGYHREHPLPTLLQILDGQEPANTPPVRVNTLPGIQFRYSGGGTMVVQQLLTNVTGQPFPGLARDLIFAPLKMDRSFFEQPLAPARTGQAAVGHRDDGKPVAGGWHLYPELAAAGLWTTPSDLARLALALQQARARWSTEFLSPEMVDQILTPQVDDLIDPAFFLDPFTKAQVWPLIRNRRQQIGLGFFLENHQGDAPRFGHGGSNQGFKCQLVAYADQGLGAVVMTNADSGWSLVEEILEAIAVTYNWPGYRPDPPAPVKPEPDLYEAYVGTYQLRPDYHFTVVETAGNLRLQVTGQPSLDLEPVSKTDFSLKGLEATVTFVCSDQGRVTGLIFKQNGRSLAAKKVGDE